MLFWKVSIERGVVFQQKHVVIEQKAPIKTFVPFQDGGGSFSFEEAIDFQGHRQRGKKYPVLPSCRVWFYKNTAVLRGKRAIGALFTMDPPSLKDLLPPIGQDYRDKL